MPDSAVEPQAVRRLLARVLPGTGGPIVARAEGGVSTPVYRARRGGHTLYVRLAERPEASLAPDVLVHRLLRARGVRVPEVVHFEPFDEALGRSVMVTTEIPGEPIGQADAAVDLRSIVIEAGRDLAVVNSLPVAGFGWIRRDGPNAWRLEAEQPTLRGFALDPFAAYLTRLRDDFLTVDEAQDIVRLVAAHEDRLDVDEARLAHGDLDATHVFQDAGRYTGIIDFGEIRGTDRFYDLGHVALHDGERLSTPLLPSLMEGYREVSPLPADAEERIHLWALLIGVRALARSLDRPRVAYHDHLARAIRRSHAVLRA